ncbi:fumarylacetoacetate hydrolase family protein [Endozoicomonadaceae bacterium StTr2]
MKLLRYGPPGSEKPGILDSNHIIRDLSAVVPDISGATLLPRQLDILRRVDLETLPAVTGNPRIGACVSGTGKLLCIGLNYADHAAESGMQVPEEPVLFGKATSAISGPFDPVIIPLNSAKTDWEVELGIVIGQPAKHVSEADALNHIAGYCIINDLSERQWQLEGTGQWIKGKSCDTFAPLGPWLVTTDEIPNPQNLDIWLEVDGHRYQNGSTSTMVFGAAALVSYLSQFFTLHTGDIISSGTPPGVGLGQKPKPVYLKPGQVMRLGISGLGVQEQQTCLEELPITPAEHSSVTVAEGRV